MPTAASRSEIVLVVEDEDRVRQMSCEALRELGYTIHEAVSGEHALRIFDSLGQVDVLFTDVVMAGMTGRQLADALANASSIEHGAGTARHATPLYKGTNYASFDLTVSETIETRPRHANGFIQAGFHDPAFPVAQGRLLAVASRGQVKRDGKRRQAAYSRAVVSVFPVGTRCHGVTCGRHRDILLTHLGCPIEQAIGRIPRQISPATGTILQHPSHQAESCLSVLPAAAPNADGPR
jgi:CheY-like chemotaxis protein